MAERKSDEQKLQELQKKMEQLKEQEKTIKARANKKARSERTRRLIQIGALSEKYFNCENIEPTEFENLLKTLVQIEQVKNTVQSNNSVLEKRIDDINSDNAKLVEHDLIIDKQ